MSFPAYPEYKDSGIELIPEYPAHWPISRFGAIYQERKDLSETGEEELLSVSAYTGIRPRAASLEAGEHLSRSESLVGYRLCSPGDLVMNIMLAWNRGLGVAQYDGIVSPAYAVFRTEVGNFPAFLNYLVRSDPYILYFKAWSSGVIDSRLRLYPDTFRHLSFPLPPLEEQRAIAAFLDRETARIDAAVAAQERLIALLAEKRAATISHAVTKGLDPNAPLKDSGIEWLGQIPAHWKARPIRKVARLESGHTPSRSNPDYWIEAECVIPWVTTSDVKYLRDGRKIYLENTAVRISPLGLANSSARLLPQSTVFLSRTASVGFSGIMAAEMAVSQDFAAWICGDELLPEYLLLCLRSMKDVFASLMIGSTHKTIYMPDIEELAIPLPPVAEQQLIIENALAGKANSESLIDLAKKSLKILHERRAALISAAVTGKIDVRGAVAENNVISLDDARDARVQARVRAVVGVCAINRLGKLGRMAVMKGGFLAEAHAGISELEGRYERQAAGPYCHALIDGMERGASQDFGITVHEGERVTYSIPPGFTAPIDELRALIGSDRTERFLDMLAQLTDFSRQGVEATATLYAAWNDLLATAPAVADEDIIAEVLTNWNAEKADKFTVADLEHWIAWMRRNDFVPDGSAPHTNHQGVLL